MSIILGTVSQNAAASTGVQAFLDSASFGGETPKLAIILGSGTGALDTTTAGAQLQLGATDGVASFAIAVAGDSSANPANVAWANRTDCAYEHVTTAGVSDGRATAALVPNGVELNWSDASVNEVIKVLLIGGAVEASVVTVNSNNGVTAQQIAHGLTGRVEAIMSFGMFSQASNTAGGTAVPGIGFWAEGTQVGVSTRITDNVATAALASKITSTGICPAMGTGSFFIYEASIGNVNAETFDLTFDSATTHTVHFICLRSTDAIPLEASAGTFTAKLTTGTQTDISGFSEGSQLIFAIPSRLTGIDAGQSDDRGGAFGFGWAARRTANGDSSYATVSISGNDGEATSAAWLNHQRSAGAHLLTLTEAGAVAVKANVKEWNADTVVHNYVTVSGIATRFAFLRIGAAGGGALAPGITSVTTVQVGETFTITGTGFSASGNAVTLGGVEQTISAESETEITCAALTLGDLRYGNQTLVVTNATAGTGSTTVAITPAANVAYTDLSGTLVGASNRPVLAPADLEAGDQVEYSTAVNGTIADSLVATTGWVGMKPTDTGLDCSFDYRVHDGTEWGTSETITFATSSYGTPVVAGSRGQRSRRHRGPLNIGH